MNEKAFEYLGITDFHNMNIKGNGIKIGYWDKTRPDGLRHFMMVGDIIRQICPEAELYYYLAEPNFKSREKAMKQMLTDGIDILNISLAGMDLDSSLMGEELYPTFRELKSKVIIVAANGNTGEEEYLKPAACDEVLGITAVAFRNKYQPLKFASFSTINDATKYAGLTNLELTTIIDGYRTFSGTSCSAPQVTGLIGLLMCGFTKKFNKRADRYDVLNYLENNVIDLEEKGYDKKTGNGLIQLNYDTIQDYVYWTSKKKHITMDTWRQMILSKAKGVI